MKINPKHRKRLRFFLNEYYKRKKERFTIFHFVKFLRIRLKDNKDAWIGVSGDTGGGKSLTVLMCQILFGRKMSLIDNVCYIPRGNEIIDKFDKLEFNTLLIDEAAKEMRSVNWQSKAQQGVNVRAMTDRFKNNAVFLNMPNFKEFTKSMRTGNIKFRMILPYRTDTYARVIIQRKSRNWRSVDPWGDDLANKIYEKMDKKGIEISNETILKIERGLPSTVMDFTVPNLELILPEVTTEYEKLKLESRKVDAALDDKTIDGKNLFKDKYKTLLNRISKTLLNNSLHMGKVNVTKSEIAKELGVSVQTLNNYYKMPHPDLDKPKNFRKNLAKEE